MDEAPRTTLGYAVLGFVIGLAALPWFYIGLSRQGIAVTRDPTWVWVFFGLVLLPAVLFYWWGRSRSRPSKE